MLCGRAHAALIVLRGRVRTLLYYSTSRGTRKHDDIGIVFTTGGARGAIKFCVLKQSAFRVSAEATKHCEQLRAVALCASRINRPSLRARSRSTSCSNALADPAIFAQAYGRERRGLDMGRENTSPNMCF